MKRLTLAIVAHDAKKDDMADFIAMHQAVIRQFTLFATGTTGARVMERCPDLSVTRLKSGPARRRPADRRDDRGRERSTCCSSSSIRFRRTRTTST